MEEAGEEQRKLELALGVFGVGGESMASGDSIRDRRAAPARSGEEGGYLGRRDLVDGLGHMRGDLKCQGNEFDPLYLAGSVH